MRKDANLLPISRRRKWLDSMELRDLRQRSEMAQQLKEAAAKADVRKMAGA
jgi:hypothetical protein